MKTPVIDREDNEIGKISDVVITIGDVFPKVTGFEICMPGKEFHIISLKQIGLLSKKFVTLKGKKDELVWDQIGNNQILLARDLLDKQIVDTDDCKVVRVNDLRISSADGELILVAADVGLSGLLRRLRLEGLVNRVFSFFGKEIPQKLIAWNIVEPLETELSRVKLTIAHEKVAQLHPADIADIVKQLTPKERTAIFSALDDEIAAETILEVEPELQLSILDNLDPERVRDIIEEMSPDDAADLLGEFPEEKAQEILRSFTSPQEAEDVEELMEYDENTAGGLMTTEFIAFKTDMTAEETIERLRELSPGAETIYYLYVLDKEDHLVGVLSLRDLVVASPETKLFEIMRHKVICVDLKASLEQVANFIAKYDLLALPVVNNNKQLMGIVTVDDVVDVIFPSRWKKRVPRAF